MFGIFIQVGYNPFSVMFFTNLPKIDGLSIVKP
jgi:hypothetical protein